MSSLLFTHATLLLADRLLPAGQLAVQGERIAAVGPSVTAPPDAQVIDLAGDYLAPGFVDIHVHGGDGSDFMDGTAEAFRTICKAHARHGTGDGGRTSRSGGSPGFSLARLFRLSCLAAPESFTIVLPLIPLARAGRVAPGTCDAV